MSKGQKSFLPVVFIAVFTFLALVNLALFGSHSAKSLVCMVKHDPAYRKSSGIPDNICTNAASNYPAGGGNKTLIECPGGTCSGGASASIDIIWQYTGARSSDNISSYQIYVDASATQSAIMAAGGCVLPAAGAMATGESKTDYDPFWAGSLDQTPLCNVDSVSPGHGAGYKMYGGNPSAGATPADPDNPLPGAIGKSYLLMTLNFQTLTVAQGATHTIYYDYAGGTSQGLKSQVNTSGLKDIVGCRTATFDSGSAPPNGCKCVTGATEFTDGCLEADIGYGALPPCTTCQPTAPSIAFANPTGCDANPTTAQTVPTLTLTGSTCAASGATCPATTACASACSYTVTSGGAGVTGSPFAATTMVLPAVTVGSAVSYSVVATCGCTAASALVVTGTARGCDAAPTLATSTLTFNGNAYTSATAKYVKGGTIEVKGTISDAEHTANAADDALSSSKVYIYYAKASDGTMTLLGGAAIAPNANGSFTGMIPANATRDLADGENFYIGIAVQDASVTDASVKCFDAGGLQSGGTAMCNFVPLGMKVGANWSTAWTSASDPQIPSSQFITATSFTWQLGAEPYPHQFPFRAGQDAAGRKLLLRTYFRLSDQADVTMRIYSLDGTLIRVLASTAQPLFACGECTTGTCPSCGVENACKWDEGCVWDGTTYEGLGHFVANGMYIVNIHAVCNGTIFPGKTLDFTKGIVVMK